MEDKRKIANEELHETLNSGILSFAATPSQNFVELPETSRDENALQGGSVTNNYNVNVNMSGGGDARSIQQAANSAMQNALPNLTGSPDEVKKNSSIDFQSNFEKDPGIFNNLIQVYDQESKSPSDMVFSKLAEFENPEVSHYSYSTSTHKQNNAKINNQYEVLKNVIYSSSDKQNTLNVSPYNATDTSFYIDRTINGNSTETITQLSIENNNQLSIDKTSTNTNIEVLRELSRTRERTQDKEMKQLNKTVRNVQDISDLNENEIDDIQEATSITPKDGAGPTNSQSLSESNSPNHFNASLNDPPTFIDKMNRPPIWRSVLG